MKVKCPTCQMVLGFKNGLQYNFLNKGNIKDSAFTIGMRYFCPNCERELSISDIFKNIVEVDKKKK